MEELKRTTRQLDEDVRALHDSVDQNTLALNQVHRRQDRSERKNRLFAVLTMALIGGFMLLGWTSWQQHQTAQRLSSVVDKSLCPLYGLIVGSYNPETRQLNADGTFEGSDRQKYIQSYEDPNVGMFAAADALSCQGNILVPPAKVTR
jgi:hypothetical protein